MVKRAWRRANEGTDDEFDQLDGAPATTLQSRLGCQCVPNGTTDVTVEIPAINKNLAKEGSLIPARHSRKDEASIVRFEFHFRRSNPRSINRLRNGRAKALIPAIMGVTRRPFPASCLITSTVPTCPSGVSLTNGRY